MDLKLQKQILRGIWLFCIIFVVLAAIYFITPLVLPFLFGWLIAYLLHPLIRFLQQKGRLPRWLSVILALLVFISVTAGLVTLVITNIVLEINNLSDTIQKSISDWRFNLQDFIHSNRVQGWIDRIMTYYHENPQYQDTINTNLTSTSQTVTDFVSSIVRGTLNGIVTLLTSLPNMAVVTVIALLAAFFIGNDWIKLKGKMISWTPAFIQRPTQMVWKDLQKALFGYLRAQLILISITALFVIIGLLILRVKYAITIGLLVGLVDLMPYLGTGTAMIPWIIYTFVQGDTYLGIGLSILYGIILVARQILEPKVLATSIGLDPLPTLIAMYVGLKLFGFLGLIIGPSTLILLSTFHRAGVFRDLWRYIVHGKQSPTSL